MRGLTDIKRWSEMGAGDGNSVRVMDKSLVVGASHFQSQIQTHTNVESNCWFN